MTDGDPNYYGTQLEEHGPAYGKMSYEEFVQHMCWKHGRYEMLHRDIAIPLSDTLFQEGLLVDEEDGPQYQALDVAYNGVSIGVFCMVPVIDVLWARARLEGLPEGGTPVLADAAEPTADVRGDAHAL